MCGGQRLCEYSPTARACAAMYQVVTLICVFYFLWFSLVTSITTWIHYTCKCGRTHAQNAGVEKLSHAHLVFLVSPEYPSYSGEKVSFLAFFLHKVAVWEKQNSFRKARLWNITTAVHSSYKYPIRFFLREKININGLFGFHKVIPTF